MNCFSKIFFSTLSQQKLMRKKFLVKLKYLLILKIKNKMKNLKTMSLQEMRKTDGGFFGPFRAGLTLAYRSIWGLHATKDDLSDFVKPI